MFQQEQNVLDEDDGRNSSDSGTSAPDESRMHQEQDELHDDDGRYSPAAGTSANAESQMHHEPNVLHEHDGGNSSDSSNSAYDESQMHQEQNVPHEDDGQDSLEHAESQMQQDQNVPNDANEANEENDSSEVKTDPEMPIQRIENISEIASILEPQPIPQPPTQIELPPQLHTFKSDDVEMSWYDYPQPMKRTEENLLKRDDDDFSGNIPFNTKVSVLLLIRFEKLWIDVRCRFYCCYRFYRRFDFIFPSHSLFRAGKSTIPAALYGFFSFKLYCCFGCVLACQQCESLKMAGKWRTDKYKAVSLCQLLNLKKIK